MSIRKMIGFHPDVVRSGHVNQALGDAVHHAMYCAKMCLSCADACVAEDMKKLKPEVEEFFDMIGLDDPLARAVAVAKTVGRMVAVVTVEDIGQIHPSIAKSLAKTGMILGQEQKNKEGKNA